MPIKGLKGLVEAAGNEGTKVNLENETLDDTVAAVSVLTGKEWASESPTQTGFYYRFDSGIPTNCTFGYSLSFPPRGDIRDGAASFQCWNIDNQEVNAGVLFLVVEEIPPGGGGTRIKTPVMLALNPRAIWYPGYVPVL
jgi:hypothetical protein